MSYSVAGLALLFVVVVHTSDAYYYGGGGPGRAPMCSSPYKPCRIRASVGNSGEAAAEISGVQSCTCSPPYQCSEDWNKPGHVVSRKVMSPNGMNITLQMIFCRAVEPLSFCRRGRVSIEMKGSMHMPLEISAYNCRCRRRQPLMLAARRYGEDYMTYHSYICANHMRTCQESARCMLMGEYDAEYPCQCREGLECRTLDSRTEGYCMP